MKLFQRKKEEKRTFDDIVTPKENTNDTEDLEVNDFEKDVEEQKSAENDRKKIKNKNNNEPFNPLSCFGLEEKTTEKWLVKCVNVWGFLISILWFLFGAITFAPIIFIYKKIDAIFNNKKLSFSIAIVIHALFVFAIISIFFARISPSVE
jgi:hypothetical protein